MAAVIKPLPLGFQSNGDPSHGGGVDHQLLKAQDQVYVVGIGSGNGGEFMMQTFDPHEAHSGALDRGKQDAAQSVAKGGAKSGFQRTNFKSAEIWGVGFFVVLHRFRHL